MRLNQLALLAATLLAYAAAPCYGQVVIGDFEQTAPGWGEWNGGVQPFSGIFSYTTDGATLNSYALQVTQSGWDQNLAYSAGTAGTIADFVANHKLLVDVTFPATTVDGYAQIYEIAINSEFGGWVGNSYTGQGAGWGAGGGGAQMVTLEYDYSNHKAAWGANTPGWVELIFATNSDANHGFFQFDNVRLVPEPASLVLFGMTAVLPMFWRRRQR